MLPYERSLVKRLAGKPFVLLGDYVPQDPEERALVRRQQAKGIVTWRCWWDERGAIANQWGVDLFPGVFLIDTKGVLRHVGLRGQELDRAIDQLLAEAEKASS